MSSTPGYFARTGSTFTGEELRLASIQRRLEVDPDAIGLIWRFDHLDVMSRAEAEHWEINMLPFGWSIRRDDRKRA